MKKIRLLFLTLWFVLSFVVPAHAGFIAAAVGLVGSLLGGGGLGAAILKAVIGAALSVAGSLLQKAKEGEQEPQGVQMDVQMGDDNPWSFIIGKYATSGKRKYIGTWGEWTKTPNAFLTEAIELSCLPNYRGEQGIESLWVDENLVTILWEEPHPDGLGYPLEEYRDVDGRDHCWVKFKDGTQTTADPWLVEVFADEPDRPYTSDMIGRGCQILIMTYRFDRKLFRNGLPRIICEPMTMPLYDPRQDTTVGGDGSQRWDDVSTWGYNTSTNNAVIIYNIARGFYYEDEWLYGGQNMSVTRLPMSSWFAAMNEADRAVATGEGGTERQFRGGLEITLDMEPLEAIDYFRRGCNGRMAEVGGALKLLVGSPGSAVYSFTDEGILITEGQSYEPFPSIAATHNGIEATYPEPAEKWGPKDAPPRYNEDWEEDDGNRRLLTNVELPATPYHRQVQRLMRAMIEEERRFRVHQFYLPPEAWALEPNDVVSWTSQRMGYSNKKFIILQISGNPSFCQLVTIRELDPADFDWEGSYEVPVDTGWVGPVYPPVQVISGFTAEAAEVLDSTGAARRPAIRVGCDADMDDVRAVQVQVRLTESGVKVFDQEIPYAAPYQWLLAGAWLLPDEDYEVRGKFIPFTRRDTDFGLWIDVHTPDTQMGSSDILDGAITAAKLADAAVTARAIMDEAITELALADRAVSTLKIQLDAVKTELIDNAAVVSDALADVAVISSKIANNAVSELKIAANAVTEAKVATGAITQLKIASGAVGNAQLAALAVDAAKLANNAVTETKISDNAITTPKLTANAVVADKIAAGAITTPKLLVANLENPFAGAEIESTSPFVSMAPGRAIWDASTMPTGKATSMRIRGAIGTPGTAFNYPAKLAVSPGEEYYIEFYARYNAAWNGTAGNSKLRFGDQSNSHLLSVTFGAGDLTINTWTKRTATYTIPTGVSELNVTIPADATNGDAYLSDFIFRKMASAELIVDGAIIAGKIAALAIAAGNIQAGAIVAGKIAADAVTAANIVAGTITSTELGANSVIAAKIAAGAVIAGKLAADSVTATNIVAGTITATELGAGAVTAVKIAAGAVIAGKIAADTVGANEIAANSITAKQLVIMDFENVILNGQFIQQANGWQVHATHAVVAASARPPERGTYILQMGATVGDSATIQQINAPVQGGEQFSIQMDAAGSGTSPDWTVRLRLVWYAAGAYHSQTSVDFSGTSVGWQRKIDGTLTAPTAADSIARVEVIRVGGGTNNAFTTNLIVRRRKNSELIVDGAIIAAKLAVDSVETDKIVLGGVTTTKIAASAVTRVASVYTSGSTADINGAGTPVTAQSLAITHSSDADAVEIQFNCRIVQSNRLGAATGSVSNTTFRILRGATVIATRNVTDSTLIDSGGVGRVGSGPQVSLSFTDTGMTGSSTTYEVDATSNYGGAGTVTCQQRYMQLMATKR